ncbi:MAG: peptidase T, partial [Nanoarchaeota archaeon]|nr:peptidase T [Nanoarchaeota archaeon]
MPAKQLISRLVEYASIDTQSSSASLTCPSTRGQRDLAELLSRELRAKGLNVIFDENYYVYAKLLGSVKNAPTVGFLAHLDTAEDAPGKGVVPHIHEQYLGGDIVLKGGVTIPASDLEKYVGDTIITSDGTTLLGGDDKAGLAVIMTAIDILLEAERKHGDIYFLFNPDEEIGRGLDKLNPNYFPVTAAYTFDGGGRG